MIERLDRLGEFGIFTGLDFDELAKVAEIARVEEFPAGTKLAEEGAEADLRRLAESDHRLGYHMGKGTSETIARRCDRAVGTRRQEWEKDLRALRGPERVVWDNGEIQLTTEAVLLGLNTGQPDVVPLEAVQEVTVDNDRLTIQAAGGEVSSSVLDDPEELAALIRDELRRMRFPYRRVGV